MSLAGIEALSSGFATIHAAKGVATGTAPVATSPELERIAALPRRTVHAPNVDTLVRRPEGTMALRPDQARALAEARQVRGLFAPIAVGGGKTLVAALLPTVLATGPTVILTNAGLVLQAQKLVREYAEHWYVRRDIRWLSYGILSSPKQFAILERLKPAIIIADECQALANLGAARAKRFNAYLEAHPETIFCAMSGTITRRSIKDYAHLEHLALKAHTPLPRIWKTLTDWAEAIDVSDRPRAPGALIELMTDEHLAEFLHTTDPERLRRGRAYLRGAFQRPFHADSEESAAIQQLARVIVQRRMTETPGVVASRSNDLDSRLVLSVLPTPECEQIREQLRLVQTNWERPDGELLTFGLEIARVCKHVRQGGYYRWVWPAGISLEARTEWLDRRREYRSALREFLQRRSTTGLDSPHLVERAIRRHFNPPEIMVPYQYHETDDGETLVRTPEDIQQRIADETAERKRIDKIIASATALLAYWPPWEQARLRMREALGGQPLPPTEWVWISKVVVDAASAWARANLGIVWTDTTAVGHAIARGMGHVGCYFGAGEQAQMAILREDGKRSIVASIKAHGTGRNLQAFARALVVGGPPSGATWEQLLGRLHRPGQTAKTTTFELYQSFEGELQQAIGDARYIEHSTGNAQKLLTAERKGF